MRFQKLAVLAFTVSCATLAAAQNPATRTTAAGQPTQAPAQAAPAAPQAADNGFFRPATNPDLTAPTPAELATRPTEALVAEDHVQANTEVNNDRAPDPAKVMQWNERQMDRSEQEAQQAKPAPGTPAPINGAFTGSTNERDR